MTPKKPYSPPRLRQMISVEPARCGFLTCWEFRDYLSNWYLPDLVLLYELLCKAKLASVNVDVMLTLCNTLMGRKVN